MGNKQSSMVVPSDAQTGQWTVVVKAPNGTKHRSSVTHIDLGAGESVAAYRVIEDGLVEQARWGVRYLMPPEVAKQLIEDRGYRLADEPTPDDPQKVAALLDAIGLHDKTDKDVEPTPVGNWIAAIPLAEPVHCVIVCADRLERESLIADVTNDFGATYRFERSFFRFRAYDGNAVISVITIAEDDYVRGARYDGVYWTRRAKENASPGFRACLSGALRPNFITSDGALREETLKKPIARETIVAALSKTLHEEITGEPCESPDGCDACKENIGKWIDRIAPALIDVLKANGFFVSSHMLRNMLSDAHTAT